MKPSNVSLLKLSRVSSRFLTRKSDKTERRWFVTILNPSAPKIKRLQRNPGLEAQTTSVESEKISLLKKALGELNLDIQPQPPPPPQALASHEDSSTEEVQNVTPGSEEEIYPGSLNEKVEKITTDDLPTIPIPRNTSDHKETNENIIQAETEEAPAQDCRIDLKSDGKSVAEGRNKLLTKKAKKSAAKTTSDPITDRNDDDSSSSDSDSSSSSSSSEDEEKKTMGKTRLDQVDLDSNPTLIQC